MPRVQERLFATGIKYQLLIAGIVVLSGCIGNAGDVSVSTIQVEKDAPCGEKFEIVGGETMFSDGSRPEVTLVVTNNNQVPVRYHIQLSFLQRTSTGLDITTETRQLNGAISGKTTSELEVQANSSDSKNSYRYEVTGSIDCDNVTESENMMRQSN
jgi:hypothetical protein|uniref:Lipoprotein n=1 Tax=uncultured haloarchaeon TaxID=160804 RepID=A5YSY8_9EURY|nr:hypothetical protein [uncultured haloarchaeon]